MAAPMVERAGQDGSRGVVNNEWDAERSADGGDFGDGEYGKFRVGQGFGVVGTGFIVGGAAEIFGLGWVDETHLDALVLQGVGEQVPGAPVKVGRGDDVVAGASQILDGVGRSGLAGSRRQARQTPPSIAARRSSSTALVGFMMRV